MPTIPCPITINCDCNDSPYRNLSSEAPDRPSFFSIGYGNVKPPLGTAWYRLTCAGFCESEVSQLDADLCAYQNAFDCVTGTFTTGGPGNVLPVPPPVQPSGTQRVRQYRNTAQTATVNCPDGLPFAFTVGAGKFSGLNQAQADAAARSFAQKQAAERQICLSNLPAQICANVEYNGQIIASGKHLAVPPAEDLWIVGGNVPYGLLVDDGFIAGGVANIGGTPTSPGTFTFFITVGDALGDDMTKAYTMRVAGITNGHSLPNGVVGTIYSQPVNSAGVTNAIFSLESGALPDGLSLDGGGIIFGTPALAGDFAFTLSVTEAGTGLTCNADCSIHVDGPTCFRTPTNLPSAATGTHYETILDPIPTLDPDFVWHPTVVDGTIPPGMHASVDGGNVVIVGTPTVAGSYCFTVKLDETPGGGGGA